MSITKNKYRNSRCPWNSLPSNKTVVLKKTVLFDENKYKDKEIKKDKIIIKQQMILDGRNTKRTKNQKYKLSIVQ